MVIEITLNFREILVRMPGNWLSTWSHCAIRRGHRLARWMKHTCAMPTFTKNIIGTRSDGGNLFFK